MSDITAPRVQHVIASGLVALVGAWVTYVSYTQQPSEAFLFPRLIASVFLVLSLWTFVKALLGRSKVGAGLDTTVFTNLLPGLVFALLYLFWGAKELGFYTATTMSTLGILNMYSGGLRSRHGSQTLIVMGMQILMALFVFGLGSTLGMPESAQFILLLGVFALPCLPIFEAGWIGSFIKNLIITAGFIAVMYSLFAVFLKVYTPREVFF